VLCPIDRATTIITDDGVSDEARRMVENAGITLVIAETDFAETREESPYVA
jgi:DeoR family ulaG and ulaABCDEF operon transcriptional repressor